MSDGHYIYVKSQRPQRVYLFQDEDAAAHKLLLGYIRIFQKSLAKVSLKLMAHANNWRFACIKREQTVLLESSATTARQCASLGITYEKTVTASRC